MKYAIFYTLLSLGLAIAGIITKEYYWFIGAIIVGACAFYWIRKEFVKIKH